MYWIYPDIAREMRLSSGTGLRQWDKGATVRELRRLPSEALVAG